MPVTPKMPTPKNPPRGARVRTPTAETETSEAEPKIALPIFLVLLIIAGMADLLAMIPLIGGGIGAVLGFFLAVVYFALGARGTAAMAAVTLGLLIEAVPLTAILPANTAVAVLVYMLSNQRLPIPISLAS